MFVKLNAQIWQLEIVHVIEISNSNSFTSESVLKLAANSVSTTNIKLERQTVTHTYNSESTPNTDKQNKKKWKIKTNECQRTKF